jgi:hypothetical protein
MIAVTAATPPMVPPAMAPALGFDDEGEDEVIEVSEDEGEAEIADVRVDVGAREIDDEFESTVVADAVTETTVATMVVCAPLVVCAATLLRGYPATLQ